MIAGARTLRIVLVALATAPGVASAVTAMQTCQVAKLKAAGKELRAEMVCYANAKRLATGVDSTCLTNARARADAKINSPKVGGACPGTATDIDAAVDNCVSAFLADDSGNGTCPSLSARVIGKGAKRELACRAKDATTPGTFATCDMDEDDKTTAGLGRVGSGTPCVNLTSVMTDIDNCDTAIDVLVTTTTTTTTSTTTTMLPSSTTTTLPPCGSSCSECNTGCPASFCAQELEPQTSCFVGHLGSGDACVAGPELAGCSGSCNSDSDCGSGEACVGNGAFSPTCCPLCPFTCDSSAAPTCGGTCASGQVCGQRSGQSSCECAPPDQTCAISQAPSCGGTCPSGQVCGQASGGNSCECVLSNDTCLISAAPTCGGTCPSSSEICETLGAESCACVCDATLPCPFVTKWGSAGSGNGQFDGPSDIAVDRSGNVFVADYPNRRIQKFTNTGTFLAKWGSAGSGDGQFGSFGCAGPGGVAVDGSGHVFVADPCNQRIQEFSNTGTFLLTFGWGVKDGMATFETCTSSCQAGLYGGGDGQFYVPIDVAVDGSGNVYVLDSGNNRIQKFTNTGAFLLTFGWGVKDGMATFETCTSSCQAGLGGSGDGQFLYPNYIAVDGNGNVFVGDTDNERIQKFMSDGTFLIKWGSLGSGDGQFSGLEGVAVNASGNVFVVDLYNNRIQKFTNTGTFVTKWGCAGSGDGQFNSPGDVAVDGSGHVFVADTGNDRIQKFACP